MDEQPFLSKHFNGKPKAQIESVEKARQKPVVHTGRDIQSATKVGKSAMELLKSNYSETSSS